MNRFNFYPYFISLLAALALLFSGCNVNAATDTALRINVGGPGYTDNQGQQWSADNGYNTGRVSTTSTTVSGTNDPALYQTERWDATGAPELKYSFALENGSYQVRLHFAETFSGAMGVGLRVFDVLLEDQEALTDLDIFSEVGADASLVKTLPVTVSDGVLDIAFLRQVQNPALRALEIYSVVRINVGGPEYTDSQGQQWSADTGYNTGRVSTTSATVSGTNDPALYQTERWDATGAPELKYSFSLENGSYQVRLHFAETFSGTMGVGLRVFDVLLEDQEALTDLDIFSEVGADASLVKTLPVTVSDGVLDIAFLRQVQNPALRALEIHSYLNKAPIISPIAAQSVPVGGTSSFTVNATGPEGITPILSCVNCPAGASFSEENEFEWAPPLNADRGEPYRVVFRAVDATDPQLVTERTAYITVADNAPKLGLIQDVTISEGESLSLDLNIATGSEQPELSVVIFEALLTSAFEAGGAKASFERASEATYHDKTGKLIRVPAGTPRFLDNDGGLLVEGPRTNLIAPSINLGGSPWVDNFGGTAIDNFGIAPDGTKTSSLVIGNASRFAGRKILLPLPLISGNRPVDNPTGLLSDHYESPIGRYAIKVYLKAGSSQRSRHGVYNDTRNEWEGFVDLEWKNGIPSIIDDGNNIDTVRIRLEETGYEGWWTLTFRYPRDNKQGDVVNVDRNISDMAYFHVEPDRLGTSGTLEVWGAQMEAGHISTSYIHNITNSPKARAADLLTYDIENFGLGFPSNNVMVENEYFPQWAAGELRGWHPRHWGAKVEGSKIDGKESQYSIYFLAKTSRSSRNFGVIRTDENKALQEDVTPAKPFKKGDLVRVAVRAQRTAELEIIPNFSSNGTAVDGDARLSAKQGQPWGEQLMVGNLTGLQPDTFSPLETDGPLNSPVRHFRVHVLDGKEPNLQGVSLVEGVFHWMPAVGTSRQEPYIITVRATDPTDPSAFVQQDIKIHVVK